MQGNASGEDIAIVLATAVAMSAQEGEPPNWHPYFTVESRDRAAEQASELGARELHRPEMEQGKIAIFADPQGAVFAVFEGEVDD